MSHTPTPAQLAKLAALQQAMATAAATMVSAQSSLATAQVSYRTAAGNLKEYESFIYGSGSLSSVIDRGGPDAV